MCYKAEDEFYNGGSAFKICARDARGVIVTVIADNYFGYCKKEVKTQISYSANLFGSAEEEHSGGALVFPSYDQGEEFSGYAAPERHSLADVLAARPRALRAGARGPRVGPHRCRRSCWCPRSRPSACATQTVSWRAADGRPVSIKLLADKMYLRPGGCGVQMEPVRGERGRWRLVDDLARGHRLPQALHRVRRRQVGDLQGDVRRDPPRARFRRRLRARHGRRGGAACARFLPTGSPTRPRTASTGARSWAASARSAA